MTRTTLRWAVHFLLLLAGSRARADAGSTGAGGPPPRPSREYTIEQFLGTTSISSGAFSPERGKLLFSPDGSRLLFTSNATGVNNVYAVPVAGGGPVALTASTTDNCHAVSWFPGDERVLYTRDRAGNEIHHLFVRSPDGSERELTSGDRVKAIFSGWAGDGRSFFVRTNERDPRFFDLYRMDAATYERTPVFRDTVGYDLGAVSADGSRLAFSREMGTADSDLWLWSAETGRLERITDHAGDAVHVPEAFDPSTRWLYYRTNDGGEFLGLRRYELATGRVEEVERADWDILLALLSADGRYLVTATNVDAGTDIRLRDLSTGGDIPLPVFPDGDISAVQVSPRGTRFAFFVSGDRSPTNLWVWELGAEGPVRLTDALSKEIDPADLVESEVVRFPSFDGMSIPSLLYRPHQASPANRRPALVFVHGGPGGQTRKGYVPLIQYLVNHGYVVLGINNRGSSGYGKTFFTADDRRHGREPLRDCLEGKAYLSGLPYVDPDRIGIIGGSYGGYMTLAALAFHPGAFAVGVDIFGVSNWVRTLESIPPWWESGRIGLYEELGDPAKDRKMLEEISPLFHADRIREPLLVLQGANDPRVIQPESDDIVAAVRKNGVPVEYIVFPDEGHGFQKKQNQARGYGAVLAFLDRHLAPRALERDVR